MNLKSRFFYNPLRSSNKKGIALLLAMTTLLLMVYVASEVTKDSMIEYAVNSQEINRIKAYYAARNSLDLALLRIKIYQQASIKQLPPQIMSQINIIWQFPFSWPLPISDDMQTTDKNEINDSMKESFIKENYTHTIIDEGSKIDINDLASPSKTLQEVTKKQILNIFESKLENDEAFKDEYQNFNFKELINRIQDWMSETNTSANGGDKKNAFTDLGDNYPPNRGFRTLDEIRLVKGMNETLFGILKPSITIYGAKAINPNTASEMVLSSLDTAINKDAMKLINEKRQKAQADNENAFNGKANSVKNQLTGAYDEVPKVQRAYKAAGIPSIVVGDHNYGEGSSREHAAMEPRFLGVKAVLVKSFARIHETNLKKQGMLALTFANESDYDKIQEDDTINFLDLTEFAPGKALTLEFVHADGSKDIVMANHTYNEGQIGWFVAGSALNLIAAGKA